MAEPDPFHFNQTIRVEGLEMMYDQFLAEEDETEDDYEEYSTDYEEEEDDEDYDDEELIPVVESPPRVSEDDEEEDEEEYDNDNDEDEDEEELLIAVDTLPRVPDSGAVSISDGESRRADEGGESGQWNRSEIDGLFCSICMDAWTNDGDHHISCLPCGHIYGLSCIKKWLKRCRNSGKCPQCNQKCSLKDVRKLFASRVIAVDEESQKRIQSLEAKCASFEKKGTDWCKKEAEWQKREAELYLKFQKLEKRTVFLEFLFGDKQSSQFGVPADSGDCQGQYVSGAIVGSKISTEESSCIPKIQERFDDMYNIFVTHKVELEKMRIDIQKILEKQEILNTRATQILALVHHHFSSGSSNQS